MGIMKAAALSSLLVIALASCESRHSAEWYEAHPKELRSRVENCVALGDNGEGCRAVKNLYLRAHGMKDAY
jgi:hypothetical protein